MSKLNPITKKEVKYGTHRSKGNASKWDDVKKDLETEGVYDEEYKLIYDNFFASVKTNLECLKNAEIEVNNLIVFKFKYNFNKRQIQKIERRDASLKQSGKTPVPSHTFQMKFLNKMKILTTKLEILFASSKYKLNELLDYKKATAPSVMKNKSNGEYDLKRFNRYRKKMETLDYDLIQSKVDYLKELELIEENIKK